MVEHENIHRQLNRLVTEVGAQRSAARRGDNLAEAWVAGLDCWLSQRETGEPNSELILSPTVLPILGEYGELLEFGKGYRCAVELNAVGSPNDCHSPRERPPD
jgi:hypothetical protein